MISGFGRQAALYNQEVIDPYWDRTTYVSRYDTATTENLSVGGTPTVTGASIVRTNAANNWRFGGWAIAKSAGAHYINLTASGSQVNLMRTGQFTIECWFRPVGTQDLVTRNYGIFASNMRQDSTFWSMGVEFNNTRPEGTKWRLIGYDGISVVQSLAPMSANVWHHIAWGRGVGNIIYLSVNGQISSHGVNTRDMSDSTGSFGSPAGGSKLFTSPYSEHNYSANFDDFRITKGVWRYESGNFPVPSKAVPTPLLP
jgi:hypothetical protein